MQARQFLLVPAYKVHFAMAWVEACLVVFTLTTQFACTSLASTEVGTFSENKRKPSIWAKMKLGRQASRVLGISLHYFKISIFFFVLCFFVYFLNCAKKITVLA